MFKSIISYINDIDKKILKLIKNGLIFSFIICTIAIIILLTYLFSFENLLVFAVGFGLLRLAVNIAVEFIVCGLAVDIITKGKG